MAPAQYEPIGHATCEDELDAAGQYAPAAQGPDGVVRPALAQ